MTFYTVAYENTIEEFDNLTNAIELCEWLQVAYSGDIEIILMDDDGRKLSQIDGSLLDDVKKSVPVWEQFGMTVEDWNWHCEQWDTLHDLHGLGGF